MKKMLANQLPVYERAIARYPHLATIKDAKTFCRQLCYLAAVPNITIQESVRIAAVAEGGEWQANRQTGNDHACYNRMDG